MSIALSLPPVEAHPANPPEIRPAKVGLWLQDMGKRDPATAARLIGDALAATNRVAMSDSKRLDLAEKYWETANVLWPQLEKQFARASHPLSGDALESAKAALTLASELSVAYKHLLASESGKRISLGGQRLMVALVHRCLQCTARILVNSYLSYAPVPPRTWHDAHLIYAFARDRNIHLVPIASDQPEATPDRLTIQSLLLALANPYGFLPGQLPIVLRYVQEYAHWAKLTDLAPVHRMAKAVAIVPVGHDFPPFSANKGGSIEGSKLFLLTFDLAFQIQEQLRALEAGGDVPTGIGRDPVARLQYFTLLKRLLRQWAIRRRGSSTGCPRGPAVVTCSGSSGVWQYSPAASCGVNRPPSGIARRWPTARSSITRRPATRCGRRQRARRVAHRRTRRVAHRRPQQSAGRDGALVRNTLKGSGLEFAASSFRHPRKPPACSGPEGRGAGNAADRGRAAREDANAGPMSARAAGHRPPRADSSSSRRSRCGGDK
jgi:hypothetical protein